MCPKSINATIRTTSTAPNCGAIVSHFKSVFGLVHCPSTVKWRAGNRDGGVGADLNKFGKHCRDGI